MVALIASYASKIFLPKILTWLSKFVAISDGKFPSTKMTLSTKNIAFLRFILNFSCSVVMITSYIGSDVVSAAIIRSAKNATAKNPPKGMCEKTIGSDLKTRLGPLSGETP